MRSKLTMNISLLFILWFGFFHVSDTIISAENKPIKQEVCLSENEIELGELINAYRVANDLKPVPISAALTKVAQTHVRDRVINFEFDEEDRCNMHSWSGKGVWKKCCYSDGADGNCMWNKPKEITGYKGKGYEIIMVRFSSEDETEEVEAEYALDTWKGSPHHNDVILNQNIWRIMDWHAMGIGIYQGYAAVWFGAESDNSGAPESCQ